MRLLWRAGQVIGLSAGLVIGSSAQTTAQEVTGYGVGYVDGDETTFGLVGAQVRTGGLGWQPLGSLEVFVLSHDVDPAGRNTLFGVVPAVGLAFAAPESFFSGRVGWQLVGGDTPPGPFFVGGESGLTTTVQAVHWGFTPNLEGLAHVSWGAEFLWTEAKAHFPVADVAPGALDLGAEVIWQTGFDGGDVGALMLGPSVRWRGPALSVALAGGPKLNTGDQDNSWYARVTVVLP